MLPNGSFHHAMNIPITTPNGKKTSPSHSFGITLSGSIPSPNMKRAIIVRLKMLRNLAAHRKAEIKLCWSIAACIPNSFQKNGRTFAFCGISFYLTTSTEQFARAATLAETLPRMNRSNLLLKPVAPTNMQSALKLVASSIKACFGLPSTIL